MYNISFDTNLYVQNMQPPQYRLPKFIIFLNACASVIAWRLGLWKDYQQGSNYITYNQLATYNAGDRVFYNFSIYESLTGANAGNNPQTSPGYWVLVNQYEVGANERILYDSSYLKLTYEINKYFKKALEANGLIGFRQPPYPAPYDYGLGGGQFSDIYITNVAPVFTSFLMTDSAARGASAMYPTYSTGVMYDPPVIAGATTYQFEIHFPLSLYNSLGSSNSIRNSVIDQFVSRYRPSGTQYKISTY